MSALELRIENSELRITGCGLSSPRDRTTTLSTRGPAIVTLILWLTAALPVWADGDDPYQKVLEANEAFEKGEFDDALAGYETAVEALGESPELNYNRAAAHYKLGQHEAAANLFAKAALSTDGGLSRRAKFNWGNCDYATVVGELQNASPESGQMPDLAGATEKLESAMRHYRDALATGRDLPAGESADSASRANIERAQRLIDMIKELMEQQQQNDQNQEQQDQEQENQQEQQGQQDEQQENEEQQDQQQQDQQEQQQREQQEQRQSRPDQQEERQMTPEEAEAVLQAVRDKEKQRREEKARRVRARRVPVVKDW
ncbi:MAG: tetratricopeptide repeat protein [Planctomycetota bacterium]